MGIVEAEKAIYFKCPRCKAGQYVDYNLEHGWLDDRCVMKDVIDCEKCGESVVVFEEL